MIKIILMRIYSIILLSILTFVVVPKCISAKNDIVMFLGIGILIICIAAFIMNLLDLYLDAKLIYISLKEELKKQQSEEKKWKN